MSFASASEGKRRTGRRAEAQAPPRSAGTGEETDFLAWAKKQAAASAQNQRNAEAAAIVKGFDKIVDSLNDMVGALKEMSSTIAVTHEAIAAVQDQIAASQEDTAQGVDRLCNKVHDLEHRVARVDRGLERQQVIAEAVKLGLGFNEDAVDWPRWSIEANGNYPFAHFCLAAASPQVSTLEEARAAPCSGSVAEKAAELMATRIIRGVARYCRQLTP